MTVYVHDSFTDTTGTLLESHTGETGATWAKNAAWTSGSADIQANRCALNTGLAIYYASGVPATNDYDVGFDVYVASASAQGGVVARQDPTQTTFYWLYYDASAGNFVLYRYVAGSATLLQTTAYSITVGTTVTGFVWTLAGGVHTLKNGATTIFTVTDTSPISPTGGATNKVGVGFNSGAFVQVDNLLVQDGGGGGTLTAGAISFTSATPTTVTMAATAATGGTSPYTYQWYRSATSGFAPGGGNSIAGATSLTLADAPPDGQTYYYKVIATDSASATVAYTQAPGGTWAAPSLSLGFIGDSITAMLNGDAVRTTAQECANRLAEIAGSRNVTITNQAISGTRSTSWTPSDPSAQLTNAKAAFAAAKVTHVLVMLGTNDCRTYAGGDGYGGAANSVATYQANMAAIVANLVAAGYRVIINQPPYVAIPGSTGGNTEAGMALMQGYQVVMDNLCDGINVYQGDQRIYRYMAMHTGEFADGLHPNLLGSETYGLFWALAAARVLGITPNLYRPRMTGGV